MRAFGSHSGHCFVAMRKGICEVKEKAFFLSSKNTFQRVFAGQSLRPSAGVSHALLDCSRAGLLDSLSMHCGDSLPLTLLSRDCMCTEETQHSLLCPLCGGWGGRSVVKAELEAWPQVQWVSPLACRNNSTVICKREDNGAASDIR